MNAITRPVKQIFILAIVALYLIPLSTKAQDSLVHSIFLIGDAGKPALNPVLDLLKKENQKVGRKGTVIFLGNNISPKGLPPKGHPLRAKAELAINQQIASVKDFEGHKIFIPGNQDWENSGSVGLRWLNQQEKYVENALDSTDVWLPSRGCPGPVEVNVDDQITVIIMDTQWFLHRHVRPGIGSDCNAATPEDIAARFQDAIRRNEDKKVLVVSHHPMYSYGPHGGVFTLKDHIFPFTANDNLKHFYLPLPIIGSFYPLYRKWFGNTQDISYPLYRQFRDPMARLMKEHPDIVHAAGHEHALQHIVKENQHYIVSGAGSKHDAPVKQKEDARFAANEGGFARLDYYQSGLVELKFISPDSNEPIYTSLVSEKPFGPSNEDLITKYQEINFQGRDTTFSASDKYVGKSNFHEWFFGKNYREEWDADLTFPIFDIGREKGGLKILKKGGGHQTISLRLEAKDGKQYVIRSMDKNPALTLPPDLRKSFIKAIVQDGISSSHPYAPLVVPTMADAAGLYHANPKIFFIPDDPRFGIYQEDFANSLVLFEERANKEQIEEPFFGEGDDVYSSPDLYEKLRKDNDNHVDQEFVVRNRLFDIWLGDWDRHDDQWRWVEYDLPDDENVYRPIPRDRDQVFFSGDGFFKKIAASKWSQPSLKGFQKDITYTPSYGFYRIRWFDRYFMTEPDLEAWLAQAKSLQAALRDEVIEKAFEVWPSEIYDLRGEEIVNKLKNRRDLLHVYAEDYYKFLSKRVSVLGSDKREYFVIDRLDNDQTKVTVYKISKKGKRDQVLYERIFDRKTTDEIKLYALDGEDEFEINGQVNKGILVRIIGGDGEDIITNNGTVRGLGKKTIVYDTKEGTILNAGTDTKNKTTDRDPDINEYDMEEFDFDIRMPLIDANYNPDDGIFIGGGMMFKKDGFRKSPYAKKQSVKGVYAFGTNSFGVTYKGEFIGALGKHVNFELDAAILSPNFVNNFFGLGNDTPFDKERGLDYYRTRFEAYLFHPRAVFQLGDYNKLRLGARFYGVDLEESEGRFITDFENNGLDPKGLFDLKTYAGPEISFETETEPEIVSPKNGITFNLLYRYAVGVNSNSDNSSKLITNLAFRYTPVPYGRTTFAGRVGYEKAYGDYEFFQSSRLDGFNTLRGFRRFRFAGESSFYTQFDVRIELAQWRNYILPSTVGLIFFNDIGRVWFLGENSNTWHHGYGGGFFLIPYNRFALNLLFANSKEGLIPLVKLGFYF
jgi:hypothetical protein